MPPVPANEPAPLDGRRKILRAGFGVPVITAVASGSALAASSSQCMVKQAASPSFGAVTDTNPTTGQRRVQLAKSGNATYYVDGRNFAGLGLTISQSYGMASGKFQQFNPEFVDRFGVRSGKESGPISSNQPGSYQQAGGKWAVLRFNASGHIVGVGGGSDAVGETGASTSCLNSIRA